MRYGWSAWACGGCAAVAAWSITQRGETNVAADRASSIVRISILMVEVRNAIVRMAKVWLGLCNPTTAGYSKWLGFFESFGGRRRPIH